MHCEQIREAIDTGNKAISLSSHLKSCTNCNQYEAQTESLLGLLSAQPRVKAPDNFEARLQARLAGEEVKLAALIGSLPTIEAPANFEFQLQRRLAQSKASKPMSNPLAWVEHFFAQSFSFGQAASAMAAVALVVAFSVTQFNRGGQPATDTSSNIAANLMQSAQTANPGAALKETQTIQTETPLGGAKAAVRFVRSTAPLANKAISAKVVEAEAKLIANNINERVIINAQTRQEAKLTANGSAYVAYGQQLTKFVATPKAEPANIAF